MSQPSQPHSNPHLTRFQELLEPGEVEWPLFAAALQISTIEHPELELGWELETLARLRRLVEGAGGFLGLVGEPRGRLAKLSYFLFNLQGFTGNRGHYYDPRNSSLKDVMERRVGLPITLSVLLLAIADRLGVQLYGVGAPGHFLVGADIDGQRVLLDPFNDGGFVPEEQVRELEAVQDRQGTVFLRPASVREILLRMLGNLKGVYAQVGRMDRLAETLDWLLALRPDNLNDVRDRGLVLLRLGDHNRAAQDLACYIARAPNAPDLPVIEAELRRAAASKARLN